MASPALAPPSVSVDTSRLEGPEYSRSESQRLRGSLVARLLELGYLVVPWPEDAEIRLSVLRAPEGFVLRASGKARREFRVEPGAQAVVSLEILHRATMVVEEVRDVEAEASSPPGTSVAIEVVGPEGDAFKNRLREQLALGLSNAGFVLAPPSAPHDRTVCVAVKDDQVTLRTGAPACGKAALNISRDDLSGDDLAEKVRDRVAKMLAPKTEVAVDDMDDRGPSLPPPTARSPERDAGSSRGEPSRGRLRFAGGTLSRSGGMDPLIQSSLDIVSASGWGARLAGGFTFSTGGAMLVVYETSIQMGPVRVWSLAPAVDLRVGLLAGPRIHHFYYTSDDTGSRVGYDFSIPAEMTLRLSSTWSLGLGVDNGLTGPPRDHDVSGKPVWIRGPYYFGMTLGLGAAL
jgi:hypothetical protein